MEILRHRRVLCRTSHHPSSQMVLVAYVVVQVENSNRVPSGDFTKGSTRNQKGFSYGDKLKNPLWFLLEPFFLCTVDCVESVAVMRLFLQSEHFHRPYFSVESESDGFYSPAAEDKTTDCSCSSHSDSVKLNCEKPKETLCKLSYKSALSLQLKTRCTLLRCKRKKTL